MSNTTNEYRFGGIYNIWKLVIERNLNVIRDTTLGSNYFPCQHVRFYFLTFTVNKNKAWVHWWMLGDILINMGVRGRTQSIHARKILRKSSPHDQLWWIASKVTSQSCDKLRCHNTVLISTQVPRLLLLSMSCYVSCAALSMWSQRFQ